MTIRGEGHRVHITDQNNFSEGAIFLKNLKPGVAAELFQSLPRLEPVHPDCHVKAGGEQLAVVLAELQTGHLERNELILSKGQRWQNLI